MPADTSTVSPSTAVTEPNRLVSPSVSTSVTLPLLRLRDRRAASSALWRPEDRNHAATDRPAPNLHNRWAAGVRQVPGHAPVVRVPVAYPYSNR